MHKKIGNYRWSIVALLFFATTINYMDRQVIGYLKPLFSLPVSEHGLGWSNTDYAIITSLFTGFYAIMTFFAGFIIDRIGTKIGLALSLIIWSVFGILNAFAGSLVAVHAIIRSLFGIGEAGNFPSSIKTITEWFPPKERALATGIFNSGSNIGAMIASIVVPLIAYSVWFKGAITGWQMAFILTGASGFIWLIFWFWLYNSPAKQKRLSKAEFDYIHSGDSINQNQSLNKTNDAGKWHDVFAFKQTWAYLLMRFLTDGIWWFLLFWLPDFMKQQFNMVGHEIMLPLFLVYGISIIGSISGGSLPMLFINKGDEPFKARVKSMLLISLLPLALIFTQYFATVSIFGSTALFLSLGVISIAAAAHQAWAANEFTVISDLFPKNKVATVAGIAGLAGGLGGIVIQMLVGKLTDYYKLLGEVSVANNHLIGDAAQAIIQTSIQNAYGIMFMISAFAYLVAWFVMKFFVKGAIQVKTL